MKVSLPGVRFEGSGSLGRGHRWLRMLETGEAASMCDIAHRESTNHSYVARHIN
ncbi:MAG: hypothetical protein J0M09_15955 [Xanthomonadales bacterium]|jgi:hypothetical protein|nr:hypothetical protein [Xanthomonadales bacterium]